MQMLLIASFRLLIQDCLLLRHLRAHWRTLIIMRLCLHPNNDSILKKEVQTETTSRSHCFQAFDIVNVTLKTEVQLDLRCVCFFRPLIQLSKPSAALLYVLLPLPSFQGACSSPLSVEEFRLASPYVDEKQLPVHPAQLVGRNELHSSKPLILSWWSRKASGHTLKDYSARNMFNNSETKLRIG